MITLTHKDVHPLYRLLFGLIFFQGAGRCTGMSSIIRRCISRSMSAADLMNQWWTRDAVIRDVIKTEVAGQNDDHP
jgi:hypothetical protein